MKLTKRFLAAFTSVIMTLSMAVGGVSVSAAQSIEPEEAADIRIGDYFQMGTYMDKPILWRCVSIDENGPLMLSDKILCFKAFDFEGENTTGSHGRGNDTGYNASISDYISSINRPAASRKEKGSNYWGDSNIRDWLNADLVSSNRWSCGNPPERMINDGGYGYYENGFMCGFTEKEKSAVKTVEQKQILDGFEYGFNENYHHFAQNIEDAVQNYDAANSETTTDRMFLLDIKQLYDVYKNLGDYYLAEPTIMAVAYDKNINLTRGAFRKTQSGDTYPERDQTWFYWLRTPVTLYDEEYAKSDPEENHYSGSCSVRVVTPDRKNYGGRVLYETANYGDIGVRPAFYLDTDNTKLTEGDGTKNDPYIINGTEHYTSFTVGGKTYNIGDYFKIGTYNNEPIVWRCVDVDENGPLMLSDKVLCNKVFDSSVDDNDIGLLGSNSREPSYLRRKYGSSYWGDSNLKEWLNSDAGEGKVSYYCRNIPSYGNEAGFLSGFTSKEKTALKLSGIHHILYHGEKTNIINGDNEYKHIYNSDISDVLQNYNEAYSEGYSTKIFIPDVKEIYRIYQKFGDYYRVSDTPYWLRTPSEKADDGYSAVRYIDNDGNVSYAYANTEGIGVRPAFCLNTASAEISGGTGTAADAYVINGAPKAKEFTFGGKTYKVGDYFQIGTYRDEPVLWRCVDVDENGPLMLSDKILCLKAFDNGGTNTDGSHGRGYVWGVAGYYRQNEGSNYWGDSNIRDWLNSDASAGNVVWSCGNPPRNEAGLYSYDEEAGFLNGFNEKEKSAVKTVTQRQVLDGNEYGDSSDVEWYIFNSKIENAVQNYDTAYSEETTDKVFLLDVKQVYNVYKNLYDYYYVTTATDKAYENSEDSCFNFWQNYWLRTPSSEYATGNCVRTVFDTGSIAGDCSACYSLGVRPAFYLDTDAALVSSGSGSETVPYVLNGESLTFVFGDADCDGNVTASDAALVLQKTLTENSALPIQGKTDDWLKYLDVDKDGGLTASDAAEIMQKTLNEAHLMPAETNK